MPQLRCRLGCEKLQDGGRETHYVSAVQGRAEGEIQTRSSFGGEDRPCRRV